MKRVACIFVTVALACLAGATQNEGAPDAKISAELNRVDPGSTVDVIVGYHTHPTEEHFNRAHALGGADKKRYSRIQSAAFTMPASALKTLASDPDVKFIAPDRKVKAHLNITAQTIHADLAWK